MGIDEGEAVALADMGNNEPEEVGGLAGAGGPDDGRVRVRRDLEEPLSEILLDLAEGNVHGAPPAPPARAAVTRGREG